MGAWDSLSVREKAAMMRAAVSNGITNIDDIRREYNKFAEGGNTNPPVITTGGAGYVPPIIDTGNIKNTIKKNVYDYVTGGLPIDTVRSRIYNNLFPGYDGGILAIGENLNRVRNAVVNNKAEIRNSIFQTDEERRQYMDDLLAEYLQIPHDRRRSFPKRNYLEDSPYKPNKSKNNANYKRITDGHNWRLPGLSYADEERLIKEVYKGPKIGTFKRNPATYNPLGINESTTSRVLSTLGLGTHTISRGYDNEKGEYVSYYDLWDMAPTKKNGGGDRDESLGIGKPVEIYDRVYLDDHYEIPDQYKGGFYLPELEVRKGKKFLGGNLFADGGIHIKPSHRGRLTELKARTGKTEAELYNDGNPAHKKMVVFARNARKWHDLGGTLFPDGGITYDGGILPELQVTGYAPIRLTTYYPVVSKYPYTGHSELEIPIDTNTWNSYKEDSVIGEKTSPYLTINRGDSSKDYSLLTNNCADATLSYLNNAFNTKENPILFTTPGDVRDYAINTLGGKVIEGTEKGSDIVLIPRNINNYEQLSKDAVLWHNAHDPHSSGFSLKGPLKYSKRHDLRGNLYAPGGPVEDPYDKALIDYVIKKEGFNKVPEDIGDGKMTLGSGLTDPRWHKLYKQKGKWTEEDNRKAVAEELAIRRKWAEKNVPNWNLLPRKSQNALLSYKYNYNFNEGNSPKMYQALRDKNWVEVARQMDATSKNPKFIDGLLERRGEERGMFLDGFGLQDMQSRPTLNYLTRYKYNNAIPNNGTIVHNSEMRGIPTLDNPVWNNNNLQYRGPVVQSQYIQEPKQERTISKPFWNPVNDVLDRYSNLKKFLSWFDIDI